MDFTLVWAVFNKDFSIKNCGRDACIKLINHLNKLYPDIYFGNISTGFLNIDCIKKVVMEELSTKCD